MIGQELLKKLEQELQALRARNSERDALVANSSVELDDCFISKWAGRINEELLETKIQILKNGGLAEFYELQHLDGTPANAKRVKTRYGLRYQVTHCDGTLEWIDPSISEKSLAKRGYKVVMVRRPAWAKIGGHGSGLAGMTRCYVTVFPSRINYWTGADVEE